MGSKHISVRSKRKTVPSVYAQRTSVLACTCRTEATKSIRSCSYAVGRIVLCLHLKSSTPGSCTRASTTDRDEHGYDQRHDDADAGGDADAADDGACADARGDDDAAADGDVAIGVCTDGSHDDADDDDADDADAANDADDVDDADDDDDADADADDEDGGDEDDDDDDDDDNATGGGDGDDAAAAGSSGEWCRCCG